MLRKRWFHIASDLITLVEDNELNVVSLKVNELTSPSRTVKAVLILVKKP